MLEVRFVTTGHAIEEEKRERYDDIFMGSKKTAMDHLNCFDHAYKMTEFSQK